MNRLLKSTNWYRNQFIDSQKFLSIIPPNLEIVNLGSTQPKFAFDYKSSGMVGMNWALGPQSFDYDLKILKQYHTHLKEGAFVLIPVCPFNFFVDVYSNDATNYKYYPFLDPSVINNYTVRKRSMLFDYPILLAQKQLVRIVRDIPPDNRMMLQNNALNASAIQQDALSWIKGWKAQFNIEDMSHISLSQKNQSSIDNNVEIVKQLVLFCQTYRYRPVFILLPSTSELSSFFSDVYVQEYMLANIKKSNIANVPVLNYFGDKRFSSSEYYINSFFFNVKGRTAFTRTVIDDLKLLKY